MWLAASDQTRGLRTHFGWGNFQILEVGAYKLRSKKLPDDVRNDLDNAIKDLTNIYVRQKDYFEAMAAFWVCG